MNSVTVTYSYNYELDFAPEYKFTKCKKCINSNRRKEVKKILKGYTLGYNIRGKFYSLKRLREHLVKPREKECPF